MAHWDYDYDEVDASHVTHMLNDVGIDDVNTYVDGFRNSTGYSYVDENGYPVDISQYYDDNLSPELIDPYTRYIHEVENVEPVIPVTPHPAPSPVPRPSPMPTPQPRPTPAPVPAPLPQPRPTPAPVPVPLPEPRPTPAPVPVPLHQPKPTPAPVPIPRVDDAKKTLDIIKKYDKNGDGKIAADDFEAVLKDLGIGVVSPKVAQVLFELVDQNKNGVLDPPEFLALAAMMDKINAKASPPIPKWNDSD